METVLKIEAPYAGEFPAGYTRRSDEPYEGRKNLESVVK
jgi:hypothetical protein